MTQQQRAIEIINKATPAPLNLWEAYICTITEYAKERIADAFLASDFCGDSVRELVKHMKELMQAIDKREPLSKTESELLRKIVEE